MASHGDGGSSLVYVTGGSGFIGSWLVRLLLGRGYTVHATVNNLDDESETKHLQALDGADARLRLFLMDLLEPDSIRPAIEGARGVFHVASPVILHPTQDPELWYNVSKTLAEKAAWDFAENAGLQLVVINPAQVLGPTLTPSITASLQLFLQIMGGKRYDMDEFFIGCVDVRDVAQSLIVLYENPSAEGRHLCLESSERMIDFTNKLAHLYPEFSVYRIEEDKQDWVVRAKDPSKKLTNLGVRFTPLDKTLADTMECFRSKGLI